MAPDSDIYLFENVGGWIECSGCRFDDPWIVQLNSVEETLAHIAKHRAAGHQVLEEIEDEVRTWNPWRKEVQRG